MTEVSGLPDASGGRHQQRARWPSQRVRLTLLLVGVAVATIAVPPLIAPRRGDRTVAAPGLSTPSPTATRGPRLTTTPPVPTPTPPAGPTPPTGPTPTPTPTRGPVFTAVSIEAEAPGNIRSGDAKVFQCDTCAGGARVGYLAAESQLLVRASIPVTGTRTITVIYEVDGPRTLKVNVNGAPQLTRELTGPNWSQPESFSFTVTVTIAAGPLTLTFYNDQAPAPDIDKVIIS